jgi:hypothetical protein
MNGKWFKPAVTEAAIYGYLAAVFETVMVWAKEGQGSQTWVPYRFVPSQAQCPMGCTSDPGKADYRTRSKWSRVLRYCAEFKDLDERLGDFIKRKGAINECAERFARCLGRSRKYRGATCALP